MKHVFIIIIFSLFSFSVLAQKQGNIWYFGAYAGLDFNKVPVQSLTDGRLNTVEGCATISDDNGGLLFYTDGITIWNKKHLVMKNGNGLLGDASATQSAIIVPNPENKTIYYVFTVGELGAELNYSIISLAGGGGLGEVTQKNNLLLKLSTERITAIRHANGKDIWVIGHKWQSGNFDSWLVTKNGVSLNPVISTSGTFEGGNDPGGSAGYMKLSPDGTKLALATNQDDSYVEVFDFDAGTGKITNPQKLTDFIGDGGPYGLEFSPNSQLLYVATNSTAYPGALYQIKLPVTSGSILDKGIIIKYLVNAGALQLAPDGKIYVTQYNQNYLETINFPDKAGIACDFISNAVYLGGKMSQLGLPTFIQSFFLSLSFSNSNNCISDPVQFTLISNSTNNDYISWDFGDPDSGIKNTSALNDPLHQYSKPGKYTVAVTIKTNGQTKTFSKEIIVAGPPIVNLGKDTTLFYGQQLILKAGGKGNTYTWNNGTTDSSLIVKAPGVYSVSVVNSSGCIATSSIKVKYDQLINVGLKKDTTICQGQQIKLDVSLSGATYHWSTGSKDAFINIIDTGTYWVEITNAYKNRIKRDSIKVRIYSFGNVKMTTDTTLCDYSSVKLNAAGAKKAETYNWYDENKKLLAQTDGAFTTPFLNNNTAFYVALTNGTCESELKKINIAIDKPIAAIIAKDTIIDPGESILLTGTGGVNYKWSPSDYLSSASQQYVTCTPVKDITYNLTVTSASGCTDTTSINIKVRTDMIIPNTFTPNGDGINDLWVIKNIERYKNSVEIFTRYGSVVYMVNNYSNNWDGTLKGKKLPSGVYYYLIKLNNEVTRSGYVAIIR